MKMLIRRRIAATAANKDGVDKFESVIAVLC
jgi:hypothetical protein